MSQPTLICFGEVLWDLLPQGPVVGGAPLNVAFHASQFGLGAHLISKVGKDKLGNDLMQFLDEHGVGTELIQIDESLPTGTVKVSLDDHGSPSYRIVEPVAWDNIQPHVQAKDLIGNADALVFGTLACRSERNLRTLMEYLSQAVIRILDINLRSPFYSQSLVQALLDKADIVKVNDEELQLLARYNQMEGTEQELMEGLLSSYDLDLLILTKGKEGAVALDETGLHAQAGFPVKVKDSVGSGDSFLAAFLSQYLRGAEVGNCLAFAGAVGALVATHSGGTPRILQADIEQMINSNKH